MEIEMLEQGVATDDATALSSTPHSALRIPHSLRPDLTHDLIFPTLLFAALGGMTWAVRGCSGYGAVAGCIFAGIAWGAAWWFISHDPARDQSRRYASGWIVLALTFGIGLAGARGWMQWPSFFENKLVTNSKKNEFVHIDQIYGFVWLFLAGVPWAGLGACFLAWCGSLRETRFWHWAIRLGCGFGAAALGGYLFRTYPQYFLPLYSQIEDKYRDLKANPTLERLINDNRAAVSHLSFFLGFLFYEVIRRDWKNVVLITTVGLVNGIGWSLCQNWKWASHFWPGAQFNFWRCWESSGGISIGVALGIAYFFVNRRMPETERAAFVVRKRITEPSLEWLLTFLGLTLTLGWFMLFQIGRWDYYYVGAICAFGIAYYLKCRFTRTAAADDASTNATTSDPNIERFGLYLGLLAGLGLSIRNGLKGWFNIYQGDEDYWSFMLWRFFGPIFLTLLVAIAFWILFKPLPRNHSGDVFPRANAIVWLVLLVLNVLAQLITGPLSNWNEVAFSIFYLLLFAITAVIVLHYRSLRRIDAI